MKIIISLLIVLVFSLGVCAAGEIDPTFNASAYRQTVSQSDVLAMVLQPDGKILVGGIFGVASGISRRAVARYNADGTVDAGFNPPELFDLNNNFKSGNVYALSLQSNGKILVGGSFGVVNSTYKSLIRLNTDGSLDTTFTNLSAQFENTELIYEIALAANGAIYIGGYLELSGAAGFSTSGLARLDGNGALDATFQLARVGTGFNTVRSFAVTANNFVYMTVESQPFTPRIFRRYNSDGSLDAAFPAVSVNGSVLETVIQPDGKILLGGNFDRLNNFTQRGISRIGADGVIDTNFNSGDGSSGVSTFGGVNDINLLADGKIVVAGAFSGYRNVTEVGVTRINADGSRDTTFASPFGAPNGVQTAEVQSDGKIIAFSTYQKLQRLNQNGTIDETFRQGIFGTSGIVYDIVQQTDGKIVAAGDFSAAGNTIKYSLARYNTDGSLDPSFNQDISPAALGQIYKISVLPDGKILTTGASGLLRLNADGTKDSSFTGLNYSGRDFEILPGGKILLAVFSGITRLLPNGVVDNTYTAPNVTGGVILATSLQPDGKIIVGGSFTQINGIGRGRIARLNADGTLDTTFGTPIGLDNTVNDIELQADGKIIIAGAFTLLNGNISRPYILRLNSNGTLDESFAPVINNQLFTIKIQPDGKIFIGGTFTQVNGVSRNRYARLNSTGAIDASFAVPTGANNTVYKVALQTDGKILLGGEFSRVNGVSAIGIARLLNDSVPARTQYDFDGDGRADVSLFRPSNGNWYILPSQTGGFYGFPFGQTGDLIAPADYDGDGKTDVAVFRETVPGAGDQAYFYILNSADNSFRAVGFGTRGDIPVAGDWDGDGKADLAVYRAAATAGVQGNFYFRPSSQPSVNFNTIPFGQLGDKPVVGDFDGDGKIDAAVFVPSLALWNILFSSTNQPNAIPFGTSTDIPVPADYDGDGKTNIAVFRPSTGTWFTSTNPATNYGAIQFGANGDLPVPADYDGDGRADAAVFRPSNGAWYINRTTSGFYGVQFGQNGDKPAPSAYIR